jgi:ribosomal protein S18 acetylase RimI-like enzyme
MRVATLAGVPISQLTATFNLAFSDYSVPSTLSEDQLQEMLLRRGFRPDLSVGVFEADALIGFTFNGFGLWQGRVTGYDTGTAVVPQARGRGAASLLLDRTRTLLRKAGAEIYLLEVIQSNEVAVRLYRRLGFEITRELWCCALAEVAPSRPAPDCAIERADRCDWPVFRALWNRDPSWQNSCEAIDRALAERAVLVARRHAEVAGYAIVFPGTGDLPQVAVAPGLRHQGVGRGLLVEALGLAARPLRVLNVDARDEETIAALVHCGAADIGSQYEMTLPL